MNNLQDALATNIETDGNCIRVVPELNDQTLLEFVGQFTATLSRKDLQDLVTALQGRLDDFAAYDDLLGRTKQ